MNALWWQRKKKKKLKVQSYGNSRDVTVIRIVRARHPYRPGVALKLTTSAARNWSRSNRDMCVECRHTIRIIVVTVVNRVACYRPAYPYVHYYTFLFRVRYFVIFLFFVNVTVARIGTRRANAAIRDAVVL